MSTQGTVACRFIDQSTMIKCGVTNMRACLNVIEETFELHGKGHTLMGGSGSLTHGQILRWPESSPDPKMPEAGPDRRFAAMPAYVGGSTYKVGIKWYGSNISNPTERQLPRSMHVILLNDPDTGQPIAILDGTLVSAMRTGAVAGVGAKTIHHKSVKTAAVVGAGVIGRTSTMALDANLDDLKSIDIFDLNTEKASQLADELVSDTGTDISSTKSLENAVIGADVVVVATAGETPPKLENEWLNQDVLVIPLGDVEMSLESISAEGIYVDDLDNISDFIAHPEFSILDDLASEIEGERYEISEFTSVPSIIAKNERTNHTGRSIFFAYGLPIEDVAWANYVFEQAKAENLGQQLTLFEEPHWR